MKPLLPAVCFAIGLAMPIISVVRAQAIPDTATAGKEFAGKVKGMFDAAPRFVPNRKMPDGPAAGNGDMALVLGGSPDRLGFYIGKSDFWGVERGAMVPVGAAFLETPQLEGASWHAEQEIGPATLAARFAKPDGHELSMKAWMANPENLLVVELTNTGARSLSFDSKLFNPDPYHVQGNMATCTATADSTSLKVSPDVVRLELGNHLTASGGESAFHGKMADFQLFDRALPAAALAEQDGAAPKPLLAWGATRLGDSSCPVPVNTAVKPPFVWKEASAGNIQAAGIVLDPRDAHGGSVAFTGLKGQGISPGVLCLPQKGFTVSVWIQAAATAGIQTILAAVAAEDPEKYPFYHGFNLSLNDGKLSARLNDASIAASAPLPPGRWVRVAAVYDVESLTLYMDGAQVGRTTQFPTAEDQMGWNKRAIHLGDPRVPYSGCAPAGILTQRVFGVQTAVRDQDVCFTLAPGEHATLLLAAVSDRNAPDYPGVARRLVQQDAESLARLFVQHRQWWDEFWSKSFVKIPDRAIQNTWYASLYLLACTSRPDQPAPGLWGNYGTTIPLAWDGDYTLNYNYQAPFWAAYASNHFELADNYETVLLDHLPRGRAIARFTQQGNDRHFPAPPFPQAPASPPKYEGIMLYAHLIPLPGWSDDYNTFIGQKSGALFCAVNIAQRWRYTQDRGYGQKVYPFLKGVADFWDHHLILQNGRYVDLDDAAQERAGSDTNPATSLAFIRLTYRCLLDVSRVLDVDADRRAKWQDICERLSPYTVVPAASLPAFKAFPPDLIRDKTVIRDTEAGTDFPAPMLLQYRDRKVRGSSGGMNCTQVIFPGWDIGIESPAALLQAARDTIGLAAEWYDFNTDCTFYPAAALIGHPPGEILSNLDGLLESSQFPNGMISTGGGGTEDFSIVPATLAAMFLQSHQEYIHVFPNWPTDQDASFGNLPACGGFLVSAAVARSDVQYVRIQSNAGAEFRIANPWPGRKVQAFLDGKPVEPDTAGPVIRFPTHVSEIIVLAPAAR